jgi:predicted DNA-binding transcriptional regulator YafY
MRGDQASRQWKILKLIESSNRGLTAPDIASRVEAGVRTVYRDLEVLCQAGFPIYNEREDKLSYWRFMEHAKKTIPLPVSHSELLTLHLCAKMLGVFEGTEIYTGMEEFIAKIRLLISPAMSDYLDKVALQIKIGFGPTKDYRASEESLGVIKQALAERKTLEMVYDAVSTGEEVVRKINPYYLWVMNLNLYLIGYCKLRQDIRTFAVDRIRAITLTEETFSEPDFSLDDYVQTAFGAMPGQPERVRIKFDQSPARMIKERKWHKSQRITESEDGGIILSLTSAINHEITSWVLGFGGSAEVLEPQWLRDRMAREMKRAYERYRGNGNS